MGFFTKDTKTPIYLNGSIHAEPTLDETSDDMKATAIDYMVSLDKNDLARFIEGVNLIWDGYNSNVDKVRTRHQKALHREAKASGFDDEDPDVIALLDDDVSKYKKIAVVGTTVAEDVK